jgi:hypothetical protein
MKASDGALALSYPQRTWRRRLIVILVWRILLVIIPSDLPFYEAYRRTRERWVGVMELLQQLRTSLEVVRMVPLLIVVPAMPSHLVL